MQSASSIAKAARADAASFFFINQILKTNNYTIKNERFWLLKPLLDFYTF